MIGGGTMGAGIAVPLLDAGIPLWLVEADQGSLDRGLARIAGSYDGQVKGRSSFLDAGTAAGASGGVEWEV